MSERWFNLVTPTRYISSCYTGTVGQFHTHSKSIENAFDHLFEIIREEGYADGGVVVEDCLQFLINLLRNNPSNQTFFKEGTHYTSPRILKENISKIFKEK